VTDVATRYDELRPLMFSIAYRMLGSVTEAEDITQEAFLRIYRTEESGESVESPEAFAVTVTTRLAIDQLRSARVRRERYVGTWLPEPWLTAGDDSDPAVRAEARDTLSTAFLVLLESLSPIERAVFLLREVFGYDYEQVAKIVDRSPVNCRQILVRAKAHLDGQRPRFEASAERRDALAEQFLAAARDGDLAGLERLLADDVVFYGDGGGKAPAVTKPVRGRVQVARFMAGIMRASLRYGVRLEPVLVNGQPGARGVDPDGNVVSVLSVQIADGMVRSLQNVLNPDKLRHLHAPPTPTR
jgi:RNA polymerase sigma-70 factor (TIGR02957 family)